MRRVVVVDSGGANLASLLFAFERLGVRARVSADPRTVAAATHVVLPGVGAAGEAMARLRARRLVDLLRGLDRPVLGVCLGMQLLFERSAEGPAEGLGVFPGEVHALRADAAHAVPHTGWNRLEPLAPDPLLAGLGPETRVYFVHGYAAPVGPYTVAATEHGERFSAVVRRGNFAGVQFHPERSGAEGARLLANFLESGPCA